VADGLHYEIKSEDVTECLPFADSAVADVSMPCYLTVSDPRLSPAQAVEITLGPLEHISQSAGSTRLDRPAQSNGVTVRTLLVDNYDSFTYNLFHYVAEIIGVEPIVVRNDDPTWRLDFLADFDNVIISPGPGTPERIADFGICRDIIGNCQVPLLGVCLGHQGIAHFYGGKVQPSSEVRHGRLSPIIHHQQDIFAGLPSPFMAIRYHSLVVKDLPAQLEAIAWTSDGVLMGIRHRELPQWGVQFHPESICTAYGHRLLRNFIAQTKFRQRTSTAVSRTLPCTGPGRQASGTCAAAHAAVQNLRVQVCRLPSRCSSERAFEELFRKADNAFWLDSSRTGNVEGRFSIMGDSSGPLARVATADVWTDSVRVCSASGVSLVSSAFMDWLDQDLRSLQVEIPDLPFDFALGWVGYLGYELKAQCGGNRVHRSTEPDAVMVFADRAVVFDHETSQTYLLALSDDRHEEQAQAWLRSTAARLEELGNATPGCGELTMSRPLLKLRHDRDRYLALIDGCLRDISAGETYEVCLTNMIEINLTADPWRCYQLLRQTSPAPFGAMLRFGELFVLSTSPERFLRVTNDGVIESKPIKGTRPRGRTPAEDEALAAELASSEKDRSENLMIVDLVRNDIGRCSRIGSVQVPLLFNVETYATVHQLVSTVRGIMRDDCSAVDCVRAAFPGGSMTGAPKIRTMSIIDSFEAGPRGVYSGAIGYFSLSGAADFSIIIRTLVIRDGRATYGVGGAIVAMSDPVAEYEETAIKSTPLLRLLGSEFPDRTEFWTSECRHSGAPVQHPTQGVEGSES
jgi:para-aminobenzoate synthetase